MSTESDQPETSSAFQALIDSIRKEAIEQAEAEAGRILTKADEQARQTTSEAKEEAVRITETAREEAAQFEASARESLKRASRDVLLGVEAALVAQLQVVLTHEATEAMRGDGLSGILENLAANWHNDQGAELEVLLSPADLEALEGVSQNGLAQKLLAGVVLKPSSNVSAGLRIGLRDGQVHYDFTAAALAEWLGQFVGPRLREILREAAVEAQVQTAEG